MSHEATRVNRVSIIPILPSRIENAQLKQIFSSPRENMLLQESRSVLHEHSKARLLFRRMPALASGVELAVEGRMKRELPAARYLDFADCCRHATATTTKDTQAWIASRSATVTHL
jgi:hypothetical protein